MERGFPIVIVVALALGGCSGRAAVPGPFALFSRDWLEPVFREDVPDADEIDRAVELAAAPGEDECASVAVRTNVPLRGARFTAGDLAGPAGAVIPATRVEFRSLRYIDPKTVESFRRWQASKQHPLLPGYLDPRPAVDVEAGTTQAFWITVRVPQDAKPGRYAGTLVFHAEGQPERTLPVALEVYPFRLAAAKPDLFLAGDNWPASAEAFADSRAHGMNTICVNQGHAKVMPYYKDGRFEFPGLAENVGKVIQLAQSQGLAVDRAPGVMLYHQLVRGVPGAVRAAGIASPAGTDAFDERTDYWAFFERGATVPEPPRFRGPYVPAKDPSAVPTTPWGRAVFDGWKGAMTTLDEAAKKNGWKKPWYWLIDEPHGNRGSLRVAMLMARAAHDAGADGMITCNEPTVTEPDASKLWHQPVGDEPALRLAPYLKVRCYHNAHVNPDTKQRTEDAKGVFGTYVNIYGNDPAGVRYQAGLFSWRLGLDMVMFWHWAPVGTTPEADGRRSYLREWEAVREGIDDLRYLTTLEEALASGKGSPGARAAAQQVLDDVRAAVPTSLREVSFVDSVSGRLIHGKKTFDPARFDEFRKRAAKAIIGLRS